MLSDFKTLLQLEILQFKRNSRDWLLLLGIDHEAGYGYLFYVAVFILFWVFAMWTFVTEQVYNASRLVDRASMTQFLDVIPLIIFIIQVIYLIVMLRGKPLKLSVPNMAYVAGSPVSRSAIALIYAIKDALIPLVMIGISSILAVMFFLWSFDSPDVGVMGLLAFPWAFVLGILTILLGWCAGLAKQNDRSRNWLYWLIVPLVILAGLLFPDVMLWLGRVWVKLINTTINPLDIVMLVIAISGALWLLKRVSRDIDMTVVIEDSQVYARIQKLGVFGQMIAPDVISSIKSQAKLAKRQVTTSKFPRPLTGISALFGYNMVNIYRLSPSLLLQLLFSGITYPSLIMLVLLFIDFNALQAWALVLIILMQMRPKNLTRFFQDHQNRPHLRQYLPADNLTLFITQTTLPLLLMSVGLALSVALQGLSIIEFLLGFAIILGLALCQVQADLPSEGFRIAYEYQVLFFGVLVIGAGYLMGDLTAALAMMIVLDGLMMWNIKTSKVLTA